MKFFRTHLFSRSVSPPLLQLVITVRTGNRSSPAHHQRNHKVQLHFQEGASLLHTLHRTRQSELPAAVLINRRTVAPLCVPQVVNNGPVSAGKYSVNALEAKATLTM